MAPVLFGILFSAGVMVATLAHLGMLDRNRGRPSDGPFLAEFDGALGVLGDHAVSEKKKQLTSIRIPEPIILVQLAGGIAGLMFGMLTTGLLGLGVLLGGLGALLPQFMAAPKRRRRQTKLALAWQLWSRQLAELAQSGAGLVEAIKGSVEHAPDEIVDIVSGVAVTAELDGIESALDELAASGTNWEPEVAAGLLMAATTGGSVADPLFDLCERIGEVVELHRSKTEAVVQLWTQTIALLVLASAVVGLLYVNNPAYFEPYESGSGQLVLVGIAGMLLLSVGFLVYHSVVRDEKSVLVSVAGRKEVKEPW